MKRVLLSTTMIVSLSSVAMAADLAPKYSAPVVILPTWDGFYLGVNTGYMTGTQEGFITTGGMNPNATANGNPDSSPNNVNGGFGGAQLGYNWEFGRVVTGIETDFDAGSIQGSDYSAGAALGPGGSWGAYDKNITTKMDWFGTARGRLGYDLGGWLPYVTGGFAYAHTSMTEAVDQNGTTPWGGGSVSSTRMGWVAGAGVEYKLNQNWSIKGEYLHINLGSENELFTGIGGPTGSTRPNSDGFTNQWEIDMLRMGVNYSF